MTIKNNTTSLSSRISNIFNQSKLSSQKSFCGRTSFQKKTFETITTHSNLFNRNIVIKKGGEILKNKAFYDNQHDHPIAMTDDKGVLFFYDHYSNENSENRFIKAKFLENPGSGSGEVGFKDYGASNAKNIFSKSDYIAMGTQAETEFFLEKLLYDTKDVQDGSRLIEKDGSVEKKQIGNSSEIKIDMQPDSSSEIQVGVQSNNQSDIQVDVQSGNQSGVQVDVQSGNQSDVQVGVQSGNKSDIQVGMQSGNQSDIQVGVQSGNQSDVQVGVQVEGQSNICIGVQTNNQNDIKQEKYLNIQENYALLFGKKAMRELGNHYHNNREMTASLNKRHLDSYSLHNAKIIGIRSLIAAAVVGSVLVSVPKITKEVPVAVIAASWGVITLLSTILHL